MLDILHTRRVRIRGEGRVAAEDISAKGIIDRHYGSLAAKALDARPADLPATPDAMERFQATFGVAWKDALGKGLVVNAREAMEQLGMNAAEIDELWTPLKIGVDKVKFGGGFYLGKIKHLYVVNGFYMAMRSKYTQPGGGVRWFRVEWSPEDMSWKRFRRELLGDTDPAVAVPQSLRGGVYKEWQRLGLRSEPHVGENIVHASASPFEALLECANWTNTTLGTMPFSQMLKENGVDLDTQSRWALDPVVEFGGQRRALFDVFENLDCEKCLEVARNVMSAERPRVAAGRQRA